MATAAGAALGFTFGDLVRRNGRRWAERDAYVELDRRVSWGAFDSRTDALGQALRGLGVGPGERVAILAADCIEVAELFAACAKIGAVRVGLNHRLAPPEIGQLILDAVPAVLLVQARHAGLAERALEGVGAVPEIVGFGDGHGFARDYDDLIARYREDAPLVVTPGELLMLAYTSGSTGLPKGALYPHQSMLQSILYITLAEGAQQNDVWLHAMPAGGIPIMHMVRNLFHGSKTVIVGDWDPELALELIERERATITVLVPMMVSSLLGSDLIGKYDVSSVRQLGYGAAPLPPATIRDAMAALGCPFLQMYGTTELMGMSMMLYPSDHARGLEDRPEILGSAGKALAYVDLRIVDDDGHDVATGETGELIVKTDFIVPGYWRQHETYAETVVDGWLHTGDLARQDDEGYVYLGDLMKFRIKTGGYNVYPTEVENVLAEHPAVLEVSVVGLPDPDWGERIHAVVTAKPGTRLDADDLKAFCKGRIADFKIPKQIDLWPELLKGATGKILRRQVIERYTGDR